MEKKKIYSRFEPTRRALIFWTLFIGIGAVSGAVCMIADPSGKSIGMDGMLPFFEKLPFSDVLFRNLTFSGIALLIVNGLTNLTAAVLLFRRKKAGAVLGGIFGVTLMLWICIQFYMFPLNFMSTSFFIFGLIQALTGYAAVVFYTQEHFYFDAREYENVGRNPKRLVVYFSRMGYVRRCAYEAANRSGAEIFEIKTTERTEHTTGFLWCGRYGMHRWEMPVEAMPEGLAEYDHVTVCTPIWVFALSAPVRAFCRAAKGKIRSVDYIIVHHTAGKYDNAAHEMDTLLGICHTGCESIQCRVGKMKSV